VCRTAETLIFARETRARRFRGRAYDYYIFENRPHGGAPRNSYVRRYHFAVGFCRVGGSTTSNGAAREIYGAVVHLRACISIRVIGCPDAAAALLRTGCPPPIAETDPTDAIITRNSRHDFRETRRRQTGQTFVPDGPPVVRRSFRTFSHTPGVRRVPTILRIYFLAKQILSPTFVYFYPSRFFDLISTERYARPRNHARRTRNSLKTDGTIAGTVS